MADKIFAHRARLRAHWGSVRKISTQQWDEGMTKVLRIQMEWSRVREDLCHVSRSGQVNVDEFLKIYQLRLSPYVLLDLIELFSLMMFVIIIIDMFKNCMIAVAHSSASSRTSMHSAWRRSVFSDLSILCVRFTP